MIRFPFSKRGSEDPKSDPNPESESALPADAATPQGAPQEALQGTPQEPPIEASEEQAAAAEHNDAQVAADLEEAADSEDRGAVGPPRFLHHGDDAPEPEAPAKQGYANGQTPDMDEQIRMVEAMLFASDKPLSTAELASRMPIGCDAAVAVRRLEEMYERRGVTLARVAGKWAFRTAADLAWLLAGEAVEQRRLSRAAIETLAIIAYHQPVTRAEIEEIRQVGVSKGTIDLLMELEWVKLGRRRQTPGRPITFVTTEAFLEHFGLESARDLPRLEELRQAGLLDSRPPVGFAPGVIGDGEDQELYASDEEEEDDEDSRGQSDLLI